MIRRCSLSLSEVLSRWLLFFVEKRIKPFAEVLRVRALDGTPAAVVLFRCSAETGERDEENGPIPTHRARGRSARWPSIAEQKKKKAEDNGFSRTRFLNLPRSSAPMGYECRRPLASIGMPLLLAVVPVGAVPPASIAWKKKGGHERSSSLIAGKESSSMDQDAGAGCTGRLFVLTMTAKEWTHQACGSSPKQ